MAVQTRKVLGQSKPAAGVLTLLYTVPGATQAIISTLTANNQDQVVQDQIKISVRVGGAADDAKQYVIGNQAAADGMKLDVNNPYMATIGITLGAADEVYVWSKNGTTSFNAFGIEFS